MIIISIIIITVIQNIYSLIYLFNQSVIENLNNRWVSPCASLYWQSYSVSLLSCLPSSLAATGQFSFLSFPVPSDSFSVCMFVCFFACAIAFFLRCRAVVPCWTGLQMFSMHTFAQYMSKDIFLAMMLSWEFQYVSRKLTQLLGRLQSNSSWTYKYSTYL